MPPLVFESLVDLLSQRAALQANDRAYVFLSDRGREEAMLSFSTLERRARAVALQLLARGGRTGDRALLLFQPGLDFIVAFFGCLLAGIIAVPMMPPRRAGARDGTASIVRDCSPRFALTGADLASIRSDVMARLQADGIDVLAVDNGDDPIALEHALLPSPDSDSIALLQYTSGSTSAPKGVMVSHANLLANLEMLRVALGNTQSSTYVSWVPLYHDMGLIANVLQTLYLGSLCVLMAPVEFLQRPLTWLRAIHDYRAEVAGAPNFAFDLCAMRLKPDQVEDLDLSCWKLAFTAAEPIRYDTLKRFASAFGPYGFAPSALYPGYGMAEATLLISAGRRGAGATTRTLSAKALQQHRAMAANGDDACVLVGCGQSLIGERIAIVDPESCRRLPPNRIGEIWVHGPHVAKGYWGNPDATAPVFNACIAGESDGWLRTGDLGFLDETAELYVTGRIKDVIIIRGMNHYPQDIEGTVEASHPALRRHGGAAFSVLGEDGQERLIIVQEVERTQRHDLPVEDVHGCIREAVANEHQISVHAIALIRPGSLPKTTSGKIQRSLTRQMWLQQELELLVSSDAGAPVSVRETPAHSKL